MLDEKQYCNETIDEIDNEIARLLAKKKQVKELLSTVTDKESQQPKPVSREEMAQLRQRPMPEVRMYPDTADSEIAKPFIPASSPEQIPKLTVAQNLRREIRKDQGGSTMTVIAGKNGDVNTLMQEQYPEMHKAMEVSARLEQQQAHVPQQPRQAYPYQQPPASPQGNMQWEGDYHSVEIVRPQPIQQPQQPQYHAQYPPQQMSPAPQLNEPNIPVPPQYRKLSVADFVRENLGMLVIIILAGVVGYLLYTGKLG